jgi:hypothetical protein
VTWGGTGAVQLAVLFPCLTARIQPLLHQPLVGLALAQRLGQHGRPIGRGRRLLEIAKQPAYSGIRKG